MVRDSRSSTFKSNFWQLKVPLSDGYYEARFYRICRMPWVTLGPLGKNHNICRRLVYWILVHMPCSNTCFRKSFSVTFKPNLKTPVHDVTFAKCKNYYRLSFHLINNYWNHFRYILLFICVPLIITPNDSNESDIYAILFSTRIFIDQPRKWT